LVDRYYELFLRGGNRRAFILQFEQGPDTDADRIRTIAIPTLILWGGLDHVVPVSDAERFHHDIVNSQLVVFSQPRPRAPGGGPCSNRKGDGRLSGSLRLHRMRTIASRTASTVWRERGHERVIWDLIAILLSTMPSRMRVCKMSKH